MRNTRKIHPDFLFHLEFKGKDLTDLYEDLRMFILEECPGANELLYHTHALTSLYSVTEKMTDGFCMIPIYSNHLNLGFNKGTLLPDPEGLLRGTGKLIRHIPITGRKDYRNPQVKVLIREALELAREEAGNKSMLLGQTISKIKCSPDVVKSFRE